MTNAVEVVPGMTSQATNVVAQVSAQVSDSLGRHVAESRAVMQQGMSWIAEHGITFLVNALMAGVMLLVGGIVVKLLVKALDKALGKSKRVDALLRTFLCSVASKTGWAVLLVIVLGRLGVDIGPLVASLGVTGVVLGFAFKESLGSLAAGLMIALNHPFRVGDYVVLGGVEGTVTELNMMATVLATADNRMITVPNSSVWGGAITNFNARGMRRVDLAVNVSYGTDLAKAMEVALEALRKVPGVLADPLPAVSIGGLGASDVRINVRPWARCEDYWNVYSAAYGALLDAYSAAGIEIPYQQIDVYMRTPPASCLSKPKSI
jgi:small conductance mechanosensitive channel